MTSADLALDISALLARQPLILYRLARTRYADLSGAGAALSPGRWNRSGQSAIYTSVDIGMPLLERLVHTPKDMIPSNLAMMKIQIRGEWIRTPTSLVDEKTRGRIRICPTLSHAKTYFESTDVVLEHGFPFAVALPSAIVPAWNVVLYPRERNFWDHVSLVSVEPFHFDPRLFIADAGVED